MTPATLQAEQQPVVWVERTYLNERTTITLLAADD